MIQHYNGIAIAITRTYMSGTSICQANGKDISEWRSNKGTVEYLAVLSETTGIPVVKLVEVREGRRGGTFVHRLAWYHLGQWCSARCAVWVAQLLDRDHAADFTRAAYGENLELPIERPEDPFASIESDMLEELAKGDNSAEIVRLPSNRELRNIPDRIIGDQLDRLESERRELEQPWHTDNPLPRRPHFRSMLPKTPDPCDACQPILPGLEAVCGVIMATTSEGYWCKECGICHRMPFTVCPACGMKG